MWRLIGFIAFVLGGVGMAGCVAGVVGIWLVRPTVLTSSAEMLDTADDALKLVDQKATYANALVQRISGFVDPFLDKILVLANKAERTPEEAKELKNIEAMLSQRLEQIDTIAEMGQTAIAFQTKAAQITRSLRFTSGGESKETADSLAKLAVALKVLRENLAKFRDDRDVKKEVIDTVVDVAREVGNELKYVETLLVRVRERAGDLTKEVAELRTDVPIWTDRSAVIGSVLLVWMALGQVALWRRGWQWMHA